jgi:hypothetical protein
MFMLPTKTVMMKTPTQDESILNCTGLEVKIANTDAKYYLFDEVFPALEEGYSLLVTFAKGTSFVRIARTDNIKIF